MQVRQIWATAIAPGWETDSLVAKSFCSTASAFNAGTDATWEIVEAALGGLKACFFVTDLTDSVTERHDSVMDLNKSSGHFVPLVGAGQARGTLLLALLAIRTLSPEDLTSVVRG